MISDEGLKYLSSNAIYSIPIPVGDGNYVTFIDIADMAAELLRRREADRWIPVSERLPEDAQEIYAREYSGMVTRFKYSKKLFDIFTRHYTHWCPLLQPPVGGIG